MPRRWVSRSRWRPSSAYPPKKLLAAADGAFDRTDPNDSVRVTGPAVYPSSHSNSIRSRREPRVIHPTCSPCRLTSSRSVIRAPLPPIRPAVVERDAESDAERLQRAQQPGDVHRAPPCLQPVEVEPVVSVLLSQFFLRDAARLPGHADRVADVTRLAHLDRPAHHRHRLRSCENIRTAITVMISSHPRLCEYPHICQRPVQRARRAPARGPEANGPIPVGRDRAWTSARGWLGKADQDIQAQVFLAEVLDVLALHDFDAAVTGRESVAVFGDP